MFPRRYELRQFQENWKQGEGKEEKISLVGEEREPKHLPARQPELSSAVDLRGSLASARQLSYLFVKDPDHLGTKDQQTLAFIRQEQELELAYRMTQQFLHLMRNRQGEVAATAWISICSTCGISELETFALGLQKEVPAFQAACSLPYNNGMTEGFVNKLKHIKGSMYGRGSFEL